MARRSQCSSQGDNPLDPHYLPPHYREEYRLAVDALVEEDLQGFYDFLQRADVVEFLCPPELEHIRRTVQFPSQNVQPSHPYVEGGDNASSDTYWPLHSDLEAPSLDLGWPAHHTFLGPTEVTMLVNPSDPNMPSIKEQARRLISSAQQVIAVVMDIFTDVDIFADLLGAAMRNVAVYIVLDELNAHYFTAMAASCKVNLEMLHHMRIRTVSGSTYFCRTGKSFRGQMMDRFLLVDCRAVLSGNYSFMWSFEKIHRCIAHLFLGELVTAYDEEFRILYAQSQALVTENAPVSLLGASGYSSHTPQSFSDHLPMQRSRFAANLRQPFGDRMVTDCNVLPFRRGEPFYNPLEPSQMQMYSKVHPSKHSRMEQSFLEQGRSMMTSRVMEIAHKRHSYAEGSHDSYGSSRQMSRHRVMNNLEGMEAQNAHLYKEQLYSHGAGSGSGSGHGINNNRKSHGYNRSDLYFDSGYPLEMEPPGSYSHKADYLSSSSSKDVILDSANDEENPKRLSMSQPCICQTSPTQLHPPDVTPVITEASLNQQPLDPGTKQGLRKWRINSFLTAMDDEEEGLPVPVGPDAFDDLPRFSEAKMSSPEPPAVKFNTEAFPRIATSKQEPMQQYSKPNLPEVQKQPSGKHSAMATDYKVSPEPSESSTTTSNDEKTWGVEVKVPREIGITKQESFRSRVNPILQRSSRLRSSLIFSNLEQNSSTMTPSSELESKENRIEEENEPLKTSSLVAQALEKRPSVTREELDSSCHKKTAVNENKNQKLQDEEVIKDHLSKNEPKLAEMVQLKFPPEEKPIITAPTETLPIMPSFINMDDPDIRFHYFKQLAAERKAAKKCNESAMGGPDEATNQKSTESPEKSPGDPLPKENSKLVEPAQLASPSSQVQQKPIITGPTEELLTTPYFINMDDPEMRFFYFKQLAAERKAAKLSKAHEATNQKSKESTSVKSPKDSLPKEETKLAKTEQPKIASEEEHAILEVKRSPKETLTDKPPASGSSVEPILSKPNVFTPPELLKQTVVKQPACPDLQYSELQPSADVPVSTNRSSKFEKANLQPNEYSQKPEIFASGRSATSIPLTDPGKLLQNKPFDLTTGNTTVVHEATDKNSKESSDKSPKEPLPNKQTKLAEMEEPGIAPQEKHVITAPTEPLPTMPSIMNMKNKEMTVLDSKPLAVKQKASVRPKGSVEKASGLTTDINVTDTNKKMADISMIGDEPAIRQGTLCSNETLRDKPLISGSSAEPILGKPDLSVAPELENQTPANVKQPAGPDVRRNDSQPSADAPVAINSSAKLLKKGIVKPPEENLQISSDKKIHEHATDTEKNEIKMTHTQNLRGVLGTQGDKKVAAGIAEDMAVSQTASNAEAKQATESVVTSKDERADNRPLSSTDNKASQSLYQTSTNSVIYSCNLRDDTKVILEQISANSQNRADLAKKAGGSSGDAKMAKDSTDDAKMAKDSTDDAKMAKDERNVDTKGRPSKPWERGTRFRHTSVNPEERENILKRMEEMRREKKIYSRFEMGS